MQADSVTQSLIALGVLSPTSEGRASIQAHAESTQMATVRVVADQYCAVEDDYPTQTFIDAQPDVIIVDMQDERAAIKALMTLRVVLPGTWLLVCSNQSDPQLIIETMQAGAREYLPKPISARSLSQAFGRYADHKHRLKTDIKTRGKVYSVTSAKGGAGATSVAINVAATLAKLPDTKIALIDLNTPTGDAAAYLNVQPQFSVLDALAAAPRLDALLLDSFMSKTVGISLLPGPRQYKAGAPTGAPSLAKLLRVVSHAYTHTFVDLPASLDPEQLNVVTDSSDTVLVVLTPELPALWRTHRLVTFLAGSGCADRIRLILNRDNSRDELDEREIKRALNQSIFWRLPNNYTAAIQAVNRGSPVIDVGRSSLSNSYHQLAHKLTGITIPRKKKGLFGLFS